MRKKTLLAAALLLGAMLGGTVPAAAQQQGEVDFDTYFYDKTMRFDFYHSGDANSESYFFDEIIEEPYYAGSKKSLINPFGYGMQMFRLYDEASGKLIYQNNYSTLFNEWQSTPQAQSTPCAMPEGVTFPYPRNKARIEFYARNLKTGEFDKKATFGIDPASYHVRHFKPGKVVFDVAVSGEPEHCLDIVLLPEGFTQHDFADFKEACRVWAEALFEYSPFTQNRERINIRAVWVPSDESGVSVPGTHQWRVTPMKAHFYTFDSERYQMTEDFQTVRDLAANAPYEYVYILSNTEKYGGGGIYNFYGLSSAKHAQSSKKVYVHEFGHQLLGLGDEYVEEGNTMSEMYPAGIEPWEANLTNLTHFDRKWKKMMDKRTPIPTPLDTIGHAADMSAWKLGVYEGGAYMSKGMYRPMPNCMMNIIHTIDEFCPVCQKAIEEYLDYLCK